MVLFITSNHDGEVVHCVNIVMMGTLRDERGLDLIAK